MLFAFVNCFDLIVTVADHSSDTQRGLCMML